MNPKDIVGSTKHPISLMPSTGILWGNQAAKNGADKYGAYNWREHSIQSTVYIDALLRHIYAYLDGEDIDPTSRVHHLGHVICGASILADAIANGKCIDTRPSSGVANSIMASYSASKNNDGG